VKTSARVQERLVTIETSGKDHPVPESGGLADEK